MEVSQRPKHRQHAPREYVHTVSEEDGRHMKKLFSTAANKSFTWLFLNQSKMQEYKARVYHLHPLTFMERVFLDESLKEDLRKVYAKGMVVWSAFTRNFTWGLEEEMKHNNVVPYIPEFAQTIDRPEEKVRAFIESCDVSGLFQYAIEE